MTTNWFVLSWLTLEPKLIGFDPAGLLTVNFHTALASFNHHSRSILLITQGKLTLNAPELIQRLIVGDSFANRKYLLKFLQELVVPKERNLLSLGARSRGRWNLTGIAPLPYRSDRSLEA
ncbi:hypothetical protein LYNGBM3L_62150 [Moorena producens 3L]|uniref:Uncharacterized protein n=1 Tax=Moorena producens 3L TaxID=489825 RepID=F4Y0N7_9CYAN|nr:hypothetical protein LYNGBM3L_62150 [Moorena producens 3L]